MKRSKLLIILLFAIGLSINTYADGDKGIRAGYQTSNIYYDGSSMNDMMSSFYIGITKDMKIIPMVHFGSGLEYSQVGTYIDADNKKTLHYLSIPLNFKLKLGPFYALAGAAANIKVGEKWIIKGSDVDPLVSANGFDIPVFAGIGFKILMFNIEARYHWGTMALYDSPADPYKTQYLQLGVGVSF
jgi:hypothetical protein